MSKNDSDSEHGSIEQKIKRFTKKRSLFNPCIFSSAKKKWKRTESDDTSQETESNSSMFGSPKPLFLWSSPCVSKRKLNMNQSKYIENDPDQNFGYISKSGRYHSWVERRSHLDRPPRRHIPVVQSKKLFDDSFSDSYHSKAAKEVMDALDRLSGPIQTRLTSRETRYPVFSQKNKGPPVGWTTRLRNRKITNLPGEDLNKECGKSNNVGKVKRHRLHESAAKVSDDHVKEPEYNLSVVPQISINSQVVFDETCPNKENMVFTEPEYKSSICQSLKLKEMTETFHFSPPNSQNNSQNVTEDLLTQQKESGSFELEHSVRKPKKQFEQFLADVSTTPCEIIKQNSLQKENISEPSASSSPLRTDSGFGDYLKKHKTKNKSSWSCNECFVNNDVSATSCIACETPQSSNKLDKYGSNSAPPSGFGDFFRKPKAHKLMWICNECFVSNEDSVPSCVACETPNPNENSQIENITATPLPAQPPPVISGFGDFLKKQKAQTKSTWQCNECFVNNEASAATCVACETPNQKKNSQHTENVTATSLPAPPAIVTSDFGDFFKKQKSQNQSVWSCKECFISNEATTASCVACEAPNPNKSKINEEKVDGVSEKIDHRTEQKEDSENKIPMSESLFGQHTTSATETANTSKFTFGVTNVISDETPKFGNPQDSGTQSKKLSFGTNFGLKDSKTETLSFSFGAPVKSGKPSKTLDSKSQNISFGQKSEITFGGKKQPAESLQFGAGSDLKDTSKVEGPSFNFGETKDSKEAPKAVAAGFQFGGTNDLKGEPNAMAPMIQFGGNSNTKDTPKVVPPSFQFSTTNDSTDTPKAAPPGFQFGETGQSNDTSKVVPPTFQFAGVSDSKVAPITASGFQFGATSDSKYVAKIVAPGFQFGANNETKDVPKPAAPSFQFGRTDQSNDNTIVVPPTFQFGGASDSKVAHTAPDFNFETTNESKNTPAAEGPSFLFSDAIDPKDSDQMVSPSFQFGATQGTTIDAPAVATPSFNFGGVNEAKEPPPAKPSFGFGASSSSSIFKPAEPEKKAAGFSFGGMSDKNKNSNNSGFSFGGQSTLTTSQTSASIFGKGNTTEAFSFENKNSTKSFSFGETAQPKKVGSIFPTAPNASVFGTSQAQPTFGQSNRLPPFAPVNPSNFSFGTTFSQRPAESQGFGTSNNTNATSLFPNSQPQTNNKPSGFGSQGSAPSFSFGQTQNTFQSQPSSQNLNSTFNQTNNKPSGFGSQGSAPSFSFGQTKNTFQSQPSSQNNMFAINSLGSGTPKTDRKVAKARRSRRK